MVFQPLMYSVMSLSIMGCELMTKKFRLTEINQNDQLFMRLNKNDREYERQHPGFYCLFLGFGGFPGMV